MAQNIFGTEVPANLNNNDSPDQYTLGTRVRPAVDGASTHGEWYFPTTSPSQPVQMALYRNSDEVLLGSATFPGGESNGRHQVAWSGGPISMLAGVDYTVAIWTADRYVSSPGYFGVDKTVGDLYCPTVAGRFKVGASLAFPDQNSGNANYWPDLTFVPDGEEVEPAEGAFDLGLGLAIATSGARASRGLLAVGLNLAPAFTGARPARGSFALGLNLAAAFSGDNGDETSGLPAFYPTLLASLKGALSATRLHVESDPSATVGRRSVVVGPPAFEWTGGMCDPNTPDLATYQVYLIESLDERAIPRLLAELPALINAVQSIEGCLVTACSPGAFPSGSSDLPCYQLTVTMNL